MTVLRTAAVATMLVVALVGCGDGGDGATQSGGTEAAAADPTPTAAATASAPAAPPVGVAGGPDNRGIEDLSAESGSVKVRLVMGEEDGTFFKPTFVKVQPGTTLAVTVANRGKIDHNFSVESQKIDFDLAPGKKRTVDISMPKKDGLRFFCKLHPDMAGAFYSQEGQDVQR